MPIEDHQDRARSEGPAKRGVDPQILRRSPDKGAAQYPRRKSEKNSLVVLRESPQTGMAQLVGQSFSGSVRRKKNLR